MKVSKEVMDSIVEGIGRGEIMVGPAAKLPEDLSKMSEKELQQRVLLWARAHGWLCYHTYNSRFSEPGFPDLVMVRKGLVIYAELKKQDGKVTAEQQKWIDRLAYAGVFVRVWRPSDLPEIERILT